RTRNPLYLGSTLVYLGLGAAAGSLWAMVLLAPLLWVINVGGIAREERYLERKFADAYCSYKGRVRRWLWWCRMDLETLARLATRECCSCGIDERCSSP